MLEPMDKFEYELFLNTVQSLKKEHKDCDPIGCPWRSVSSQDARALWAALYAAGLVVSVGFDPQHLFSLSKEQAERLLEAWGKKYSYVMKWYSENYGDYVEKS